MGHQCECQDDSHQYSIVQEHGLVWWDDGSHNLCAQASTPIDPTLRNKVTTQPGIPVLHQTGKGNGLHGEEDCSRYFGQDCGRVWCSKLLSYHTREDRITVQEAQSTHQSFTKCDHGGHT